MRSTYITSPGEFVNNTSTAVSTTAFVDDALLVTVLFKWDSPNDCCRLYELQLSWCCDRSHSLLSIPDQSVLVDMYHVGSWRLIPYSCCELIPSVLTVTTGASSEFRIVLSERLRRAVIWTGFSKSLVEELIPKEGSSSAWIQYAS